MALRWIFHSVGFIFWSLGMCPLQLVFVFKFTRSLLLYAVFILFQTVDQAADFTDRRRQQKVIGILGEPAL